MLEWSRARKRYERQGLLVEEAALQQAEQKCLAEAEARARRREQEADRRAELDQEYIQQFAARVRELFPACPDEKAVLMAVSAHTRHAETNYDELLAQGWDRSLARDEVGDKVDQILEHWQRE